MRERHPNRKVILLAALVALNLFGGIAVQAQQPTTVPSRTALPQTIRYILFIIVVLVGIFLVTSFAFLRWSRRFRDRIFREPSRPTSAEDVWAMHKLPAEPESENTPEPDQNGGEE